MKNDATLQVQFRQRKGYLEAWGKLVTETVVARINEKYADPRFFEVPPGHRVKNEASFMAKAFSPKKNYADPINNIEDQVGVRFEVLLMAQVRKIGDIIEAETSWVAEKARDLLAERENEPASFGYQSDHYVVRNRKSIHTDHEVIPAGTPCEIQTRTLLQHAYSQLTHDLTYKPKQAVTSAIHRCNARSMALIEVTDDLFAKASEAQILANKEIERVLEICRISYTTHFAHAPQCNTRIEAEILDAYTDFLPELSEEVLDGAAKSPTFKNWKEGHSDNLLADFAVTISLVPLIRNHPIAVQRDWPLFSGLLETLVTACGESILER